MGNAILGGFFILIGLVMIFWRSDVYEFVDGYTLPWGLRKSIPRHAHLVIITVFGALSTLGGFVLVLLSLS